MTALPADAHVHSEWSWDTGGHAHAPGRMALACERALAIGVPSIVFTEHVEYEQRWRSDVEDLMPHQRHLLDADGYVRPPAFDVNRYLAAVEECRARFPQLRILTGVELSEPHRHIAESHRLSAVVDRVNGSVHTLPTGGHDDRSEPNTMLRDTDPDEVVIRYLMEVVALAESAAAFATLTHIDYAARAWPADRGRFDARRFEGHFRAAMLALARSGRALELNTRRLEPWVPLWWAEEGGRAITFGRDAHEPSEVGAHFSAATAMAAAAGFAPGPEPHDFWTR
ncbi:PHP domain-containing protein [Herbiconiux sp. L3-i23]|uniref:PHP domain-containing protein n=1 Tax=Herbiconiux sp. L3-i23 TaxID=2905871 RepID=UPI00206BBC7A|nr:PHP domain-containing protein [Herbiconiux sp. L3-i23]BDI24047.1 hypothetical protein L3i23_28230 [Herbiconiux sp. L3-i23]